MKISDFNITKDLNNMYSSMKPLIWILKIFAINCNIDKNLKASSSSSVLFKCFCTSLILGCLNFYCLYYKIMHVYVEMDLSIILTDMVQITTDYFQYIVDLFFVYKYGANICGEYYKQYEKIDKFLEISCYSAMKRRLLKLTAFFVTIWIISSFCDLGAWLITYGIFIPLVHSISYVFLFIKMLTILDLIAHVLHIEERLKIVAGLVRNYYFATNISAGELMTDCIRNENWLYQDTYTKIYSLRERSDDYYEIKLLTKCYLLVTEQVTFINKLYGFRILLNTMSLLLDMVKVTNLSIRIAIGTQPTLYNNHDSYLPGLSGMMRLLTCATIILSLVFRCEQAYRQREQVINVIDHLLVNKNPDQQLRSLIVDFRTLLQERPIRFNMANFFTLNYSLLVSITSVVITYTIILLQSIN